MSDVCDTRGGDRKRSATPVHRGGTVNMPVLLAKNLLFWGSISATIYGLYAVVAAL
ncbi:hypothetical protein FIV00_21970 [Labrenzia sp. THAF82]|nr:hypothetical protein FIV00_21970 [Labrenzia sp. THAF82]